MPIDADTTVAHLRTVGCTVTSRPDPDRAAADLAAGPHRPYDLVEEVARIVGYAEVPSVLPPRPGRGLTRAQKLRRRVGFALAGAGLVEVRTWPFVGAADLDHLGLPAGDVLRDTVRVANPLSEEGPLLTTTLLPALLHAAARNVGRGPGAAIYETAPVFFPTPERLKAPILGVEWRPDQADLDKLLAAVPRQPLTLGVVLAGDREASGWWGTPAGRLGRRRPGRP